MPVRPDRADNLTALHGTQPVQREEREEDAALAPRQLRLDAPAVDENRQRAAELDFDPCQLNANIVPRRQAYNAGRQPTEGDPRWRSRSPVSAGRSFAARPTTRPSTAPASTCAPTIPSCSTRSLART